MYLLEWQEIQDFDSRPKITIKQDRYKGKKVTKSMNVENHLWRNEYINEYIE